MMTEKNISNIIDNLIKKCFDTDEYSVLGRMGGMTNLTYHVAVGEKQYVVRVPGEGTEELICRSDEKISTELAGELGIDANLLYFGDDGCKVTEYIPDAVTMTEEMLRCPENICLIANILKILHTCNIDTKVKFDVFDMAAGYEKIIEKNNVDMYDDYEKIKYIVMKIKNTVSKDIDLAPCHNDPLCANWVKSNDRMYLIDWEYAGMNDAMWDLADISIESGYSESEDKMLLEFYLGRVPTELEKKRFEANKLYLDYLWTLWGKARVPYEGEKMEEYALERYNRLKNNTEIYLSLFDKANS